MSDPCNCLEINNQRGTSSYYSSHVANMPSCSCTSHDEIYDKENANNVIKLSSKKIKVNTIDFMRQNNYITKHASAVCSQCVFYVEHHVMLKKTKNYDIKCIIKDIKENNITCEELEELARAIGEWISPHILKECDDVSQDYKDINTIRSHSSLNWVLKTNTVLRAFLCSTANIINLEEQPKKTACISGAIDSIYKARMLSIITPQPFYTNMVSFYLSGSKSVVALNNLQRPAGSYTSRRQWLKQLSLTPKKVDFNNDTVTFFDNNQTISRNWRVTFNYKPKASVVTTVAHIAPPTKSNLQCNGTLMPSNWLYSQPNQDVTDKIRQELRCQQTNYKVIRDDFLTKRMIKLYRAGDYAQEIVEREQGESRSTDPYDWVPSHHSGVATVTVGEPSMANPCSYESVRKVLQHLQSECGVGKDRQWTVLGCDGLPYTLGNRLIDKNKDLQNIFLIPGHGHLEMNAVKACFKLLWDPALKDLAKMLGFKSPRAQLCCKNCTDHHKAYMILQIFMEGTIDEVLGVYLRQETGEPSLARLYDFIGKSRDKNYRFLCDAVLNTVLAVFVFRCGVRRNSTHHIQAARAQFMSLFFGFNMTNYQEINFRDLKAQVLAPREVKGFMETTESFTVSGHPSKGEGGDFVLEAVNKRTKGWLPPGIPTETHWRQVCRNIDVLHEMKMKTMPTRQEPNDDVYQRDTTREILEWRKMLREHLKGRTEDSVHTSVSGALLDRDLMCFETTCTENVNLYLQGISEGGDISSRRFRLTPVFPTEDDRVRYHDINRKTKSQIVNIVENLLKTIFENGDVEESLVLERQWQTIKVKTKNEMLEFYKEVVVAVENSTTISDVEAGSCTCTADCACDTCKCGDKCTTCGDACKCKVKCKCTEGSCACGKGCTGPSSCTCGSDCLCK